jgi:16S rRNA (uracil1498-N3)-methyltransferase
MKRQRGFRPRFFVADAQVVGVESALSADDSHHAARVLRLQPGDACELVAPQGRVYRAVVVSVGGQVVVRPEERLGPEEAGAVYAQEVGLVQALAKSSAVDYVVEKGTEVGASFFVLIQADGSPKGGKGRGGEPDSRAARWVRIAVEAAKQSKQTRVPAIEVLPSVQAAVAHLSDPETLSLVLEPQAEVTLADAVAAGGAGRVALWVGPEGGWSPAELEVFSAAGVGTARLGSSILRTETAGPVAVAVTRLILQDW